MSIKILFLVSLLFILSHCDFSDIACSGFVEFPQEDSIDFSKIEIHLLNEDRKLIEKTICSENGFFLLPIYDRRKYILKVVSAENLVFTPAEMNINLENKSEAEIRKIFEEMHNFKFSGFLIKAKIFSLHSTEDFGPSSVLLAIYNSVGEKISETKTLSDGSFILIIYLLVNMKLKLIIILIKNTIFPTKKL